MAIVITIAAKVDELNLQLSAHQYMIGYGFFFSKMIFGAMLKGCSNSGVTSVKKLF